MNRNARYQKPPAAVCAGVKTFLAWFRRHVRQDDTAYERFMGKHGPHSVQDAPMRLEFRHEMTAESVLRLHERADWTGVDQRIARFAAVLVETLRKQGVPMYVHSARRTPAEQARLYAEGRSRIAVKGAHTTGCAVDIVHAKFHWQLSREEWRYIGIVGKQVAHRIGLDVEWGGDWSFFDPAHWELKGWRAAPVIRDDLGKVAKTPRFILRQTAQVSMTEGNF